MSGETGTPADYTDIGERAEASNGVVHGIADNVNQMESMRISGGIFGRTS